MCRCRIITLSLTFITTFCWNASCFIIQTSDATVDTIRPCRDNLYNCVYHYNFHHFCAFDCCLSFHRSSLLSAAVSHWSHLSAAQIKSLTRCRREQNTITRLSQQSPADSLSLPASPSKWNANHSARLQREFTVRLVSVWPEVSAADCQVWIYWPWNKLPGFYFLKSPIKPASCNINPVRMINWQEERTYDQTHPEKS